MLHGEFSQGIKMVHVKITYSKKPAYSSTFRFHCIENINKW